MAEQQESAEFNFIFLPRRGHYELLRALSLLPFVDLDTKRRNVQGLRQLLCLSHFKLKTGLSNFSCFVFNSITIFILVINQLDAQNLFYNKFISCLYMFRAPCAHRQEVKIVLYSPWYHHTETSEWSKITKIIKLLKYINMST